jgi:hypothetical protein
MRFTRKVKKEPKAPVIPESNDLISIQQAHYAVDQYENITLQKMGEEHIHATKLIKTKPVKTGGRKRTKSDASITTTTTTKIEEVQPELQAASKVLCGPELVGQTPQILKMQDLPLRNASMSVQFTAHLKNVGRRTNEVIASIPSQKDVLAFIKNMENVKNMLWFHQLPQQAIKLGLEIPVIETVTPEYVAEFLREPHKDRRLWERHCLPPINKKTNTHMQCESVAMGGSRAREFLLPSQYTELLRSPYFTQKQSGDRTLNLPKLIQPCFLCQQRTISIEYGLRKYPQNKDNDDNDDDNVVIIHNYMMAVGSVGYYNPMLMLPGYKHFTGIVGPIIEHDRNHYVRKRLEDNMCDGWIQTDEMFFHNGVM